MSNEEKEDSWWQTMLWGILMIFLAGALYWYFIDFESSQDTSRRMNAIVAILYTYGGKNLPCGIMAGIGGILCFFGFIELIKGEK